MDLKAPSNAPAVEANGNGLRQPLTVGETDGRVIDQTRAVTRTAIRQLIVFVGGTGLETLDAMCRILAPHRVRFGDESLAAHRPIVPHALFVDTDARAVQSVEGNSGEEVDDEARRRRALIENLQTMGVKTCVLFSEGRSKTLVQSGLSKHITPGIPAEEDPRGSKADPRVGILRYLVVADRDDDTNPRKIARDMVQAWRELGNAFLGKETLLTFVGGLHGGTGQLALPLMAHIKSDMAAMLRGTGTSLETERFAMTAESSGLDEAMRTDGLQLRRDLNTASGVILANAAIAQGGVEILPPGFDDNFVSGIPSKFTFVVGGQSQYRQVRREGGHYQPTTVIAEQLASRILGLDLTATGRSNAKLDIEAVPVPGRDVPNEPKAAFSALGVSKIISEPSRAELTAQKRQVLFDAVLGLGEADAAKVQEQLGILFPEKLLEGLIGDAEAPQMLSSDFGLTEEAQASVEMQVQRFTGDLRTKLQQEIRRSIGAKRNEMKQAVDAAAKATKLSHGLATTIALLEGFKDAFAGMETAAKEQFDNQCSKQDLDALEQQGQSELKDVKKFKIPKYNILSNRDKKLMRLGDMLNQLAATYTNLAGLTRDHYYTRNVPQLLASSKQLVSELLEQLRAEREAAGVLLSGIRPDEREIALETPFDLPIAVTDMNIEEDTSSMRRTLGSGAWTAEAMRRLIESINMKAEDIGLVGRLTPAVLEALEKLSAPLARFDTVDGAHSATSRISIASVPAATMDEAKAIPVPYDSTRLPVGPEGTYMTMQELHGINALLDDAYVRDSVRKLLATPPTRQEAELLQRANPHDLVLKHRLSREGQFPFKGQAQRLLPPVFKSLAERQLYENGGNGDIVEQCPGSNCGVPFYRSPADQTANVECCPACRRLPRKKQ